MSLFFLRANAIHGTGPIVFGGEFETEENFLSAVVLHQNQKEEVTLVRDMGSVFFKFNDGEFSCAYTVVELEKRGDDNLFSTERDSDAFAAVPYMGTKEIFPDSGEAEVGVLGGEEAVDVVGDAPRRQRN